MCKGKKAPAGPGGGGEIHPSIPVFMDSANDGDLDGVVEIYDALGGERKSLLSFANGKKQTALHLAANNGHADIVEYLVMKIVTDCSDMADDLINRKDQIDFTPLFAACFRGYHLKGDADYCKEDRLAIVRCLLENGAQVSPKTSDTHMTPAHWAAYNKDEDVVRVLLKAGAEQFVKSCMDRLPIDVAGSCRAYEVVDVFLEEFKNYEQVKKENNLAPKPNRFSSAKSMKSMGDSEEAGSPFGLEEGELNNSFELLQGEPQIAKYLDKAYAGSTALEQMDAKVREELVNKVPKVLAKQAKVETHLRAVRPEDIEKDAEMSCHARYLYWACFRGNVYIIKHILDNENLAISPFAPIYEGRSALMASIIGKSNLAQWELCQREFKYEPDQDYLENQMLSRDYIGNNPLHFAFRSRKPATVELMIRAGFGDLEERNNQGKTAKETTHQRAMMKSTKNLLGQFDPSAQKPAQPDYIFVVNKARVTVLYDQFESLNEGCESGKENIKEKTFKHSLEPDKKMIVCVYFSDAILNEEAENQELLIQLQDKFQNIPFKDAGRTQYQRFRGVESIRLIKAIFKKEFNIQTLIEGGVVFEHFMLHTSKKFEIVESISRNKNRLIFSMLSFGSEFKDYFEPINLIADYYGEKYALYLAFVFHHVAWLIPLSVLGSLLFGYHIVAAVLDYESGELWLEAYLKGVDTVWNYAFLFVIAIWSTLYVESWKRKQATIQYLWGLLEKEDQITRSVKLKQRNAEYVFDAASGTKKKKVLKEKGCFADCLNFLFLLIFSALAIIGLWATRYAVTVIDFDDEEDKTKQKLWEYLCVFFYSLWASLLSQQIAPAVEYAVTAENHEQEAERDNSSIGKYFFLSTVISYAGLFYYQYYEKSYSNLCLLMLYLQIFNQIVINAYKSGKPYKEYPQKFAAHKTNFKPHCRRFPEDYEKFSKRATHYEAEQQTLMAEMPANRIDDYCKVVIEFGWITFFGPCFPAAPLLGIVSNLVNLRTEIDNIKMFAKRGEPKGVIDVGRWVELIEYIAVFSIVNSLGLVIFTSKKLQSLSPETSWYQMVIVVFMAENLLLVFRYVLALLIPDEPDDITDERRAMEHRVEQIQGEISDKVLLTKLKPEFTPLELVHQIVGELHADKDLGALLVPKILKGCYAFEQQLQELEDAPDEDNMTHRSGNSAASSRREKTQAKVNKVQLKIDQGKMKNKMAMLRKRHKDE